jgi:hypothetical protein
MVRLKPDTTCSGADHTTHSTIFLFIAASP